MYELLLLTYAVRYLLGISFCFSLLLMLWLCAFGLNYLQDLVFGILLSFSGLSLHFILSLFYLVI